MDATFRAAVPTISGRPAGCYEACGWLGILTSAFRFVQIVRATPIPP